MKYTIRDLYNVSSNVDNYIEIFNVMIYHNVMSPTESFNKYVDDCDENMPIDFNILRPIIQANRIDILEKLYSNGIILHRFPNIITDIYLMNNVECLDLMVQNGFKNIINYAPAIMFKEQNHQYDKILEYIINNDPKTINYFLRIVITKNNYCLIKLIIDKADMSVVDLNQIFFESINSKISILNKNMVDELSVYGFDLSLYAD